jgi:soluble lytic murein transglycosylase-like protein
MNPPMPRPARRLPRWLPLLLAACPPLIHEARADVYLGWSETAVPIYSDRPREGFTRLLDTGEPPAVERASTGPANKAWREGRRRYSPFIAQAAAENSLSPELLHAVVQVESAYDPLAISPKGAVGLMQLMPATAARMGVANRRDPLANLRGGARYLRELVTLFDGELPLVLAAYNAGEQAVQRHDRKIPPYAETQAYVRAVLRRYADLGGH